MNKIFLVTTLIFLLFTACEETPEPSDPCDDNDWATALRDGEEHCIGVVEVNYFHPNTTSAVIIFSARNATSLTPEIYAEFTIPVDGVALNTPYPIKTGKILDADPITSGSLTLLAFDPPAQGKTGCFAGTFSLAAGSSSGPAIEYTNGRFVYYKGTVYAKDNISGNGCNPF